MGLKLQNLKYVMSFVFNTPDAVFEGELKQILSGKGYTLEETVEFKQGPMSFKNMKMATKRGCDVVYNSDVPATFVAGTSPQDVRQVFWEIKNLFEKELKLTLSEVIRSYEMISENHITTKKRPHKIIADYYKECDVKKFEEIFNSEMDLFTIRILPKDKNPQNPKWCDVVIEPASLRTYFSRIIYRNNNIEEFKSFSETEENTILNAIETLEGRDKK